MSPRTVKGQSMLFAIFGLAVLILLGIIFALAYPDTIMNIFSSLTLGKDAAKAEMLAEECLQDAAIEGLQLVEAQGGYTRPSDALFLDDIPLGYISQEGIQVLRLSDVEEDIARYTDAVLPYCFEEGFEQYAVEQNLRSVSIQFEEENMLVTADWDLRFIDAEGKTAFVIDELRTEVSSYFKPLFEEAERFIPNVPSIDSSVQYYNVQDVSVRVMRRGNESIAYFSYGEDYFVTVYA